MQCQKCGFQVPDNEKYCGKCGAKLLRCTFVCPKCHKEYNYERKYCGECGTNLVNISEKKEERKNIEKASKDKYLTAEEKKQKKARLIAASIAGAIFFIPLIMLLFFALINHASQRDTIKSDLYISTTKSIKTTAPVKAVLDTKKETDSAIDSLAEQETQKNDSAVPREFQNALEIAKQYNKVSPMSKAGLYEQLTSEYGEKFSKEAAQYAIENIDADWKENACKTAEKYLEIMPMSKDELYDQLISEYGEQYTPEEAQYAVDKVY